MKKTLAFLMVLLLAPVAAVRADDFHPSGKITPPAFARTNVLIGGAGGINAVMLTPVKPITSNPWLLAPAFYDPGDPAVANLNRVERELARLGFHVVCVPPGAGPGGIDPLAVWNYVYQEMTGKYNLSKSVLLLGVGDDGPAVLRWAAGHPGKVPCIYLDTAVCDVPPNLLAQLVAGKTAILYVAGSQDDHVPFAENGGRLQEQYRQLKGSFKLIMRSDEGGGSHGLADPGPIMDFIRYRAAGNPEPTFAAVPYGSHSMEIMDFWRAQSPHPTPVALFMHGGGWLTGSRFDVSGVQDYLKAGISVASMEYRFTPEAVAEGIKPPVKGPMDDIARAVQFIRSQAGEWNVRKDRIAAFGGSAGACSSLWLAFHKDMAVPESPDPVARESTRLWCVAALAPQTSLDPQQMRAWTPNSNYGGHAFGFTGDPTRKRSQFDVFFANRGKILPWIAEYSPYALATADAPPVYLYFPTPPDVGHVQKDPTHTANFGVKLAERLQELKVPCELVYPGAPDIIHRNAREYLIDHLNAP